MEAAMDKVQYHCLRCGRDWEPKNPQGEKPKNCPRCKSPYWDMPFKRGPQNPGQIKNQQSGSNAA
jgi:DNA-directed RNA polymerase subunit RPC12/RpoP